MRPQGWLIRSALRRRRRTARAARHGNSSPPARNAGSHCGPRAWESRRANVSRGAFGGLGGEASMSLLPRDSQRSRRALIGHAFPFPNFDRRRIKPNSSLAGRSYRAGRAQSGYALYPRQGEAPTNTRPWRSGCLREADPKPAGSRLKSTPIDGIGSSTKSRVSNSEHRPSARFQGMKTARREGISVPLVTPGVALRVGTQGLLISTANYAAGAKMDCRVFEDTGGERRRKPSAARLLRFRSSASRRPRCLRPAVDRAQGASATADGRLIYAGRACTALRGRRSGLAPIAKQTTTSRNRNE